MIREKDSIYHVKGANGLHDGREDRNIGEKHLIFLKLRKHFGNYIGKNSVSNMKI